jgi:acyl carrier protein
MKGSADSAFKLQLKQLILDVCGKEDSPDAVADDGALFGDEASLALDSIDGLQIAVAIQQKFGNRITDPKEARAIMISINSLADYLHPE